MDTSYWRGGGPDLLPHRDPLIPSSGHRVVSPVSTLSPIPVFRPWVSRQVSTHPTTPSGVSRPPLPSGTPVSCPGPGRVEGLESLEQRMRTGYHFPVMVKGVGSDVQNSFSDTSPPSTVPEFFLGRTHGP